MFKLSEEQLVKLNEWKKQFEGRYEGASGGAFTYCFTPTSLGDVVVVQDSMSGKEIDLSDYDSW